MGGRGLFLTTGSTLLQSKSRGRVSPVLSKSTFWSFFLIHVALRYESFLDGDKDSTNIKGIRLEFSWLRVRKCNEWRRPFSEITLLLNIMNITNWANVYTDKSQLPSTQGPLGNKHDVTMTVSLHAGCQSSANRRDKTTEGRSTTVITGVELIVQARTRIFFMQRRTETWAKFQRTFHWR